MDKSEHENVPAVATEYIDAIIKKMRYRKKVRAEVRRELADHFADALADCKDENERHKLAKELIEQFGDAKLLGVLLRRAKKRCRPLWRTMVVRMFQAVGVLILLLVFYVGWFLTGKPIVTTDYLEVMNRQVRPVADDSLNAWPYYKRAVENYVEPADKEFDKWPRPLSSLTPEHREILLKWIADNHPSLDLVRQGNQKPHYWREYEYAQEARSELITVAFPYLWEYRSLSYLMCWQSLLSVEANNFEAAYDHLLESYSFGRRVRGHNTTYWEQLIAISIEGMAIQQIRDVTDLHLSRIDVSVMDSLRQRLQQEISEHHFIVSYETEKLFIYDELQRSFTQPRIGKSHLYIHRLMLLDDFFNPTILVVRIAENKDSSSWAASTGNVIFQEAKRFFHILFTHPDRDETVRVLEAIAADLKQKAALTPASLHAQGLDVNQKINEARKNNLLFDLMAPVFSHMYWTSYRSQVESLATLTILAVLQYHKSHGDYPDSLTALVETGLLEEMPIDPFSDAPLVYRRTDDGFTLYSVGLNFTDDGGVPGTGKGVSPVLWADDGDAVFWPVIDR